MRGRCKKIAALGLSLLVLAAPAALADSLPGDSSLTGPMSYPGEPKPQPADQPAEQKPAFAMTYAEEAAQHLGVHDGRMDLFSTQPSAKSDLIPRFSGGVGRGGAMIQLQWKAGP